MLDRNFEGKNLFFQAGFNLNPRHSLTYYINPVTVCLFVCSKQISLTAEPKRFLFLLKLLISLMGRFITVLDEGISTLQSKYTLPLPIPQWILKASKGTADSFYT